MCMRSVLLTFTQPCTCCQRSQLLFSDKPPSCQVKMTPLYSRVNMHPCLLHCALTTSTSACSVNQSRNLTASTYVFCCLVQDKQLRYSRHCLVGTMLRESKVDQRYQARPQTPLLYGRDKQYYCESHSPGSLPLFHSFGTTGYWPSIITVPVDSAYCICG
jgi:hypothetical protein